MNDKLGPWYARARCGAAAGFLVGGVAAYLQSWRLGESMARWPLESQLVVIAATWALVVGTMTTVAAVAALVPGLGACRRGGVWVAALALAAWIGVEWYALGAERETSDLLIAAAVLGVFTWLGAGSGGLAARLRSPALWALLQLGAWLATVAALAMLPAARHGAGLLAAALAVALPAAPAAALLLRPTLRVTRRRALLLYGMAVAVPLVVWAGVARQAPARPAIDTPIVWISVDTLRADHLGCYGADVDTPHLDALAERAVLFEEAISPIPITCPSHTTMMTGLHPSRHGVVLNGPMAMRPNVKTLPERFQDIGYRTAAFVSGYPLKRQVSALAPRFELYEDDFGVAATNLYQGDYGWLTWLPEAFFLNGLPRLAYEHASGSSATRGGYERSAAVALPRVLRWLRHNREHPSFLFLHLFDPHGPYLPPQRYVDRYDPGYRGTADGWWYPLSDAEKAATVARVEDVQHLRARYKAEISFTDAQLGTLFDELEDLGLFDEALIIFTSDHGESLGEHEYWFDHSRWLYDASLHVPLLLKLPANAGAGARIPGLVSLMDLAPTVLEALGMTEDEEADFDGHSLLEAIRQGTARITNTVVSTAVQPRRDGSPRLDAISLRTADHKFITQSEEEDRLLQPETIEFYDLALDPAETRDLSAERPEEVAAGLEALRPRVEKWIMGQAFEVGELSDADRKALEALGYLDPESEDD